MKYKEDYSQTKKRLLAFWEKEIIDRPLISVTAPKVFGANTSPFKTDMQFSEEELRKHWEDAPTILDHNLKRLNNTYFGGDTLPIIFFNFGPSGHCAYYGSKPSYQPDTVWYEPVFNQEIDASKLVYDDAPLNRQLKVAEYIYAQTKGEWFLSMPDNTGTIDAVATLVGAEDFLFALIEQPEEIKKAIKKVNEGHKISTLKFYKNLKKMADNGCMHGWMHLYATGVLQHMQCDTSVMLSPTMYEEFVLPELYEQMEWIEYPVYHFDGIEQIKHLDMLLSLKKLRAIQWTHVAGQPNPAQFLDVLKRIQIAGKNLIVMTPACDVSTLATHLSPKGLYIHTEAQNVEEANSIVEIVEKTWRQK